MNPQRHVEGIDFVVVSPPLTAKLKKYLKARSRAMKREPTW